MHVIINAGAISNGEAPISQSAAALVRMNFNPSTLPQVDRFKALAAAFVSEVEAMKSGGECDGREAALAITKVQEAVMFAVASATSNL